MRLAIYKKLAREISSEPRPGLEYPVDVYVDGKRLVAIVESGEAIAMTATAVAGKLRHETLFVARGDNGDLYVYEIKNGSVIPARHPHVRSDGWLCVGNAEADDFMRVIKYVNLDSVFYMPELTAL